MADQLAFVDASGGMNAADPPHKIQPSQLARMVNCAIVDKLPTTRPGTRTTPLDGPPTELIALGNIQGSKFFNPAKGQGGIVLSKDGAQLALAVAGRKFIVRIEGRKSATKGVAEEITNQRLTNPKLHLVWFGAWENILLAQDGESNAFIWDGVKPAFFSKGYNTVQKHRSRVPNRGTVLAYAHSRGVAVVNKRLVLVGDSLHRISQTTSDDLLKFVDQVYWATGRYFLPPSQMGDITAADILPTRNTQHGHGDLMLHCEDGVFSIDLNIFPRSAWQSSPMVKHALLDSGAVGPYALDIYDGDQIFRSTKGVQTLRSAAAASQLEGNPFQPISTHVDTWLNADYPRWLRFASVKIWDAGHRFFCTTQPVVHGSFRWHRGMVVRNFDPIISEPNTPAAWEGLWTLPPETRGIVQFVGGLFDGEERLFAWTRGSDRRNRLVEFTTWQRDDILEDGSERRIEAFCVTRAIDAGKWWIRREFKSVKLYLRNIEGELDWGVWFRPAESPAWHLLRFGRIVSPVVNVDTLEAGDGRTVPIPLGDLPHVCDADSELFINETRGIQFLVRWRGYCQFEGLKVGHGEKDMDSDELNKDRLNRIFSNVTDSTLDDFEYSNTVEPDWIPAP